MANLLGIDVGSTTVKVCVIRGGEVVYSSYVRHFSRVKECVVSELGKVREFGTQFRTCITGSAGLGLAQRGGICFVQEVQAAFGAIRKFYPDADAAVELGGEDAKIIFISSLAYDDTIEEAKEMGCNDFLFKPIEQDSLLEVLTKASQKADGGEEA